MPRITTSDLVRIFYRDRGAGIPLVLIHGLGSCTEDWTLQTAHFGDKYRVITIDLRGHGKSARPLPQRKDYSISRMAADVIEVLKHLDAKGCHIVGLSMGACVSLHAVLDNPKRFRSLTLVNGPINPGAANSIMTAHVKCRLLIVKYFGTDTLAPIVARRIFPHPHQEELRRLALKRIGENPRWTYYAAIKAIGEMRIAHRLDSLRIPTLIVIGEDDRIVSFKLKQKLVKCLKNSPKVTILKKAGHAAPLDSPEKFNAILDEWLTQI